MKLMQKQPNVLPQSSSAKRWRRWLRPVLPLRLFPRRRKGQAQALRCTSSSPQRLRSRTPCSSTSLACLLSTEPGVLAHPFLIIIVLPGTLSGIRVGCLTPCPFVLCSCADPLLTVLLCASTARETQFLLVTFDAPSFTCRSRLSYVFFFDTHDGLRVGSFRRCVASGPSYFTEFLVQNPTERGYFFSSPRIVILCAQSIRSCATMRSIVLPSRCPQRKHRQGDDLRSS